MFLCFFLEKLHARLSQGDGDLHVFFLQNQLIRWGRKSLTTLNSPIGSSVYLILFFIDLPPFSPIPRTINADDITSICDPNSHDAAFDTANTVKSFLPTFMGYIFYDDTMRIKKSMLP